MRHWGVKLLTSAKWSTTPRTLGGRRLVLLSQIAGGLRLKLWFWIGCLTGFQKLGSFGGNLETQTHITNLIAHWKSKVTYDRIENKKWDICTEVFTHLLSTNAIYLQLSFNNFVNSFWIPKLFSNCPNYLGDIPLITKTFENNWSGYIVRTSSNNSSSNILYIHTLIKSYCQKYNRSWRHLSTSRSPEALWVKRSFRERSRLDLFKAGGMSGLWATRDLTVILGIHLTQIHLSADLSSSACRQYGLVPHVYFLESITEKLFRWSQGLGRNMSTLSFELEISRI